MSDLIAHVEKVLRDRLAATHVEVIDESDKHRGHEGAKGGAKHLRVIVVSSAFEGQGPVARHRMVNALFAEEMNPRAQDVVGKIHALALETKTPDEWSKSRA